MNHSLSIHRATLGLSLILCAGTFSGCGEEEVSIENLAPGEECISGGVQITRDGKVTIECIGDPDIVVEYFAPNQGDNPCYGSAILTTDRSSGVEVATWTCQTVGRAELSPYFQDLHDLIIDSQRLDITVGLHAYEICDDVPEESRIYYELYRLVRQSYELTSPCIAERLLNLREPSETTKMGMECVSFDAHTTIACIEGIDSITLDEENPDCRDAFEAQLDLCTDEAELTKPVHCTDEDLVEQYDTEALRAFQAAILEIAAICTDSRI